MKCAILLPVSLSLAVAAVPPAPAGERGQQLKLLGTLPGARPIVLGLGSAIAFSPDGKTLASFADGAVKLWDVDKRRILATLRPRFGERGPDRKAVAAVAFSPDGRTLASAGDDGTVRLWDVATGKVRNSFKGSGPVAFSPDGKTLAAGLTLWDLPTGKARPALKGLDENERGMVNAVAFSADGKTLAVGGGGVTTVGRPGLGWVRVWEVATGHERLSIKGQEFSDQDPEAGGPEMVRSVAFSPDGKTLASASLFGSVILWDLRSGRRKATLQAFDPDSKAEVGFNPAFSVAFRPDGAVLAVGTLRGLRFWDVKSGKAATLKGPAATVWSVAFRRDGLTVATAEAKRRPGRSEFGEFSEPAIRLWELPASMPLPRENEAEALFRAMEKQIREAKAFRVVAEIRVTSREKGKKTDSYLKGSLVLTRDNRARLTIRGKVEGAALDREWISDGKRITWKDGLPKPAYLATQTTPEKFHALLSALVLRAGVYGSSESISVANGYGDEIPARVQRIDAWGFRDGGAARVGGREARLIRFKVGLKGDKGAGQAALWIDARTRMPLRYAIGDENGRLTEIYHEFRLDPQVDARGFRLPK